MENVKNTRRRWSLVAAAALTLSVAFVLSMAHAQNRGGHPAAKATVQFSQLTLIEASAGAGWATMLSNTMRTPNQKDLIISCSAEAGLYTSTEVKSKGAKRDTSEATAAIKMRVVVDGVLAYPGEVTMASRRQELSAVFGGILDGCLFVDGNGNVVIDEACVAPEELSLLLDTMSAVNFDFICPDLTAGVHLIELQCKVVTNTAFEAGSALATATVGKGSMTVQEVRLIKNEDIELE